MTLKEIIREQEKIAEKYEQYIQKILALTDEEFTKKVYEVYGD